MPTPATDRQDPAGASTPAASPGASLDAVTPGASTPAVTPGASLDAVLRPVRSGNAFEEAVQRIMQAIKLGAVTAGERLPPERTLAKRLGISRVTLREALRALHDAGHVESRRGRSGGTFIVYRPEAHEHRTPAQIAPNLRSHLQDGLVLRAVLEPGVAETAATRTLDDAARDHLRARLREVSGTAARETHRLADARLHLAIAELTGSVSVIAAVADVQMSLGELLDAIPVLPANIEHSQQQHAGIVEAILDGRPDQARRRMRDHVEGTAALLHGFLD